MHRLCPMLIAALLVGAAVSNAVAQPPTAGIVSSPCPPPDPAAEARQKLVDDLFMTPAASPEAFWAGVRETPGHRPGGRRGTQPRATGRRLAEPVSLQGGECGARPWTAPSRRVHGRLDHRQLGTRRSGAVCQRHRRSWHRRPDVAADAGTVPSGRRCAATACRAHHGWHQRRRRQYRSYDTRGLPAQHAGDDRPRPRQRHRRRRCRDTAVAETVLARRSRSTPADSRVERVAAWARVQPRPDVRGLRHGARRSGRWNARRSRQRWRAPESAGLRTHASAGRACSRRSRRES